MFTMMNINQEEEPIALGNLAENQTTLEAFTAQHLLQIFSFFSLEFSLLLLLIAGGEINV